MFNLGKLVVSAALLAAAGCASVANTSRTGTIHDVSFEERMTPATVRVQPGDEVRWVNQRTMPVTVEFLGGALDDVTCQEGFDNILRRQQESATIEPNQSASLCFANPGTITYNARMESAVAGGQNIERGTIRVGQ